MKIVRVRISGWAIQKGDEWMFKPLAPFYGWTEDKESAHIFKRPGQAEAWLAENNL